MRIEIVSGGMRWLKRSTREEAVEVMKRMAEQSRGPYARLFRFSFLRVISPPIVCDYCLFYICLTFESVRCIHYLWTCLPLSSVFLTFEGMCDMH